MMDVKAWEIEMNDMLAHGYLGQENAIGNVETNVAGADSFQLEVIGGSASINLMHA